MNRSPFRLIGSVLPFLVATSALEVRAEPSSTNASDVPDPRRLSRGEYPLFQRWGAMLGRRPPLPFGNCYPAPRGHGKQGGPKDGVARTTGELRRLERRAKLAEAEWFACSKSDARRFRATCAAALRA